MNAKYKPAIGLEIHAELKTKTKMFCDCANDPNEARPNINICPVCTGHPGTLPTINKEAVMAVIKLGLSLGGKISKYAKFDRKNYFYPDLPKGYQISQYDSPLVEGGKLMNIQLTRVHLEEDTANLFHTDAGSDYSLVNFNRSSIPLMELVTEPDIKSADEALIFAKELQLILRYLGISDADMENGQMRVEVNISLREIADEHGLNTQINADKKISVSQFTPTPKFGVGASQRKSASTLGTKVEVKNLNSFRAVEKSINYEIERQAKILESGGKIIQETRGWDENKGQTFSQRIKEEAHDYRYMPEPDLPILLLRPSESEGEASQNGAPRLFTRSEKGGVAAFNLEKLRMEIPELPAQKRKRFIEEYKLPAQDIEILVSDKKFADYFEKAVSELDGWISDKGFPQKGEAHLRIIKMAVNFLMGDIQYLLSQPDAKRGTLADLPAGRLGMITPENFAEFVTLVFDGEISSAAAKIVLAEMFNTGGDPSHIISEKGLSQITDESEIEKIIEKIISENPGAVKDFKEGKANALQFLIGKAMAKTGGKASPVVVKDILLKNLR